jgi:predicted acyltransferase
MRPEWWGILGLIGWAYLTATAVYWAFRKNIYVVAGVFVALVVLNAVDKSHISRMNVTEFIGLILYPIQDGAHASITIAGVITSMLFLKNSPVQKIGSRLVVVLGFALVITIAGYFLAPLGISKIGATPTWCLYSAAICCILFVCLYWLVDVKGVSRWANFLTPAAVNPLLTYILPFIYYYAIGPGFLGNSWRSGLQGILSSIIFSLIILGIAALLTRWRVRLQL